MSVSLIISVSSTARIVSMRNFSRRTETQNILTMKSKFFSKIPKITSLSSGMCGDWFVNIAGSRMGYIN